MRPDLNEARLQVQRGDLEVVRTKNGLLPKPDAFISFGKSGFASSFGDSVGNMDKGNYDLGVGLALQYPMGNRGRRENRRARGARRLGEQ